jgi:hypothetical protein
MANAEGLTLRQIIESLNPTNDYETPLTPEQEIQFQAWKKIAAPRDSGADYDYRGAWLAGVEADPVSAHWPDTFKKPNHPTFSVESQYAPFAPERAGHWHDEEYHPRNFVELPEEELPEEPSNSTIWDILNLIRHSDARMAPK